jgi:hypothetical protein
MFRNLLFHHHGAQNCTKYLLNVKQLFCTNMPVYFFLIFYSFNRGPGGVVGITTGMCWAVWGLNSVGGEIFRACPDRPWGPPSLLYNGYRVVPGGKERPGRDADPSPPSSAVVMKE